MATAKQSIGVVGDVACSVGDNVGGLVAGVDCDGVHDDVTV